MRRWKRVDLLFGLTVYNHSWGQELVLWANRVIENYWPLRQATWPCLPLGSWRFPWCRTQWEQPILPLHAWSQKWSGPNKRGQGSSAGRFMSLRSSNSLLETSFKATVRILPMNDEFAHSCLVVFVLCSAAGSDAKKRLNCKNVRRIKLSGALYALHWVILYFLSWH